MKHQIGKQLPNLPFSDASFDLALCSHLLVLYSVQLGGAFHHDAIPGDLQHSCLDPGRAQIHLGWKPWTKLDDGVGAVLRYFRDKQTS